MNIEKAKRVSNIVNKIDLYNKFIESIQVGYRDEYTIYYNGSYCATMSEEAINLLINFYQDKIKVLEKELMIL